MYSHACVDVLVFYSAPKPYSGMRTILFHPTSTDHRFAVLYDQGMDVWMLPQNQDQVRGQKNHSARACCISSEQSVMTVHNLMNVYLKRWMQEIIN